ncbi:recombinase family protein [Thalassotalea hakodatensis]|uniref:recombinase family protein n=1 Tax=Thalassotalea hakodatensis TaxID=3030492 RepID=UPI002573ECC9|nr:recombinase family protein [Thalassotalea hakodatensis]
MNKPKLYSYIRWSSDKQTKGDSLERQLEYATKIATEHDLELVKMLDAGVSAFKGNNADTGALGDFLEAVKAGVVPSGSWLVVENLDRLSRQQILESNELFSGLLRREITVVTGMDNKVYSKESVTKNPMDLMYSIMLFARAHEESQTKANRTNQSALRAINKFNDGVRSDDGYALPIKAVGSHPWMFDTSHGDVREHPLHWNVAKDIVSKILSGMGSYKICEYLNATYEPPKQRKNKKRNTWSIDMLRKFHKREYIRGIKRISIAGVEYELNGYYPSLVDDTTYFKMQNIRDRNKVTTTSRNYVGLFTGIRVAKCGHCTDSLSFFTSRKTRKDKVTGESVPYNTLRYICTNKQQSTKNCDSGSMDAKRIEDTIIRLGLGKIWKANEDNSVSQLPEIEANKSKLSEFEQQESNLVDKFVLFNEVPDSMVKKMNELQVNIADTKAIIEELEQQANAPQVAVSDIEQQWKAIPPSVLDKDNNDIRTQVRGMIRDSVRSITIWKLAGGERAGNEIEIEFKDGETVKARRSQHKLTLISHIGITPSDVKMTDEEASREFDRVNQKLENLLFWNMDENQLPMDGAPKVIDKLLPFKDGKKFIQLHPPKEFDIDE